jgi:PTS system nitrogen regulatory IIA component
MSVKDLLAIENIHLDVSAGGKAHLLHSLAALAARATKLEAAAIAAAVDAREALGSTGVGKGLALPHARLPGLQIPFVLFARLATPLRFDAIDERPVDLVAFVLLPPEPAADVNVLGCVARALRDGTVAERVRKARTATDVLEALASPA